MILLAIISIMQLIWTVSSDGGDQILFTGDIISIMCQNHFTSSHILPHTNLWPSPHTSHLIFLDIPSNLLLSLEWTIVIQQQQQVTLFSIYFPKCITLASPYYAASVVPAYLMQNPSQKLISNQPTQEFGLDYSAPRVGVGGEVN